MGTLTVTAVAASGFKLPSPRMLLAIRNILGNTLDILRSASGSPAGGSFAQYIPNVVAGNQERAVAPPLERDHYHCVTQEGFNDPACLQVGYGGCLPGWVNGSTVYFVVCDESFKDPSLAKRVRDEPLRAINMWGGIGVTFKEARREEKATFQIKYEDSLPGSTRKVYACSFFPQTTPGTLFVFGLALETANIGYLANILAHEIGHILGLRHEFAADAVWKGSSATREPGSVLWGKENDSSVMNYFPDLKQYSVQDHDRQELRDFYVCTEKKHKGLEFKNFEPGLFNFSGSGGGMFRALLSCMASNATHNCDFIVYI
ncbi:hypothetical protein GGR51DRAFT_513059 [Nemania sp. FL0031]|nr:hypothetical protein GGR51DRAFT_513059 [Nemania sp. FL0031]